MEVSLRSMLVVLAILLATLPYNASATSPGPLFVYEGVLSNSAGQALSSPQTLQLQILYEGTCVLFEETHANISLGPAGEFKVVVGTGQRTDLTTNKVEDIFTASGTVECSDSPSTTMNITEMGERTLRFKVGSVTLSPDMEITQVPFTMNATRIENKKPSDLLQISAQLTQSRLENFITTITAAGGNAIKWDGSKFVAFNPHDGSRFSSAAISEASIQDLPYTKVTAMPASLLQIGGLSCVEGKLLKHVGGFWTCADESGLIAEQDPGVQPYAKQSAGSGLVLDGNQLQLNIGTTAGSALSGADTRLVNAFIKTTNLTGDMTGTLPAPTVAKIQGNFVNATTLSSSELGQVYRWNGSELKSEFLNFGDLRNNLGSPQLNVKCEIHEKIQWSSLTDSFNCESIGNLDGSSIAAGTMALARLPAADENMAGIVNQVAQKFSGIKTFLNNVFMSGSLSITGALNANSLKVGDSNVACNSSNEGSFRYNPSSKKFEGCDGSNWSLIYTDTENAILLSAPSRPLTKAEEVQFIVTFGNIIDESSINLNPALITLTGDGATGCTAAVTGSGKQRMISVKDCVGTGTVHVTVEAGSALLISGEPAPKVGPSIQFVVDNSGPMAPSDLQLSDNPISLSRSPVIYYTGSSDIGFSQIAGYQVQVVKQSDNTVVRDWTYHINGSPILNLNLDFQSSYVINVRSVDALGNISPVTQSASWIASDDPCIFAVTPGTLCKNGTIYLGSLSWGSSSVTSGPVDRYMTTPGGCGEIPAGQISGGSGYSAWSTADFTPTCSGTDHLEKFWDNGTGSWYDLPNVSNYSEGGGTGFGATYKDNKYGSQNTVEIAAITAIAQGGHHAAARYCDKLIYGGYNDWYLPNRFELNLLWTNRFSISGLDFNGTFYWSSSEYTLHSAWVQRFSDGYQGGYVKSNQLKIRCIRRF